MAETNTGSKLNRSILGAPLFPHWLAVIVAGWFTIEYVVAFGAGGRGRDLVILIGWAILWFGAIVAVGRAWHRSREN